MPDDLTISATVVLGGDSLAAVGSFLGVSEIAGDKNPETGQPTYSLDTDTISTRVQEVMIDAVGSLVSSAFSKAIAERSLGLLPDDLAVTEQARADAVTASMAAQVAASGRMKQASLDATCQVASPISVISVGPSPIRKAV